MSLETGLVITTSIMSVVGVGSITGIVVVIKNWGKMEEHRLNEIKEIHTRLDNIETVLNNGGLVGGLKEVQMNCAAQMTRVMTLLESHMSSPGHGDLPITVAKLDARVEVLESMRK